MVERNAGRCGGRGSFSDRWECREKVNCCHCVGAVFISLNTLANFLWVYDLQYAGLKPVSTRECWSNHVPLHYGLLLVCDGVSICSLSPLWAAQPLFAFYPDRLHKTEPKHHTEKMEGMVAAWRIKSNLLSSLHLPTSIHPFICPSSLPCLPLPAFHDFFQPPTKLSLLPSAACPYLCQEPDQSIAAHS